MWPYLSLIIEDAQNDFGAVVRPSAESQRAALLIERPVGQVQFARRRQRQRWDVVDHSVAQEHQMGARQRLIQSSSIIWIKCYANLGVSGQSRLTS